MLMNVLTIGPFSLVAGMLAWFVIALMEIFMNFAPNRVIIPAGLL